MKRLALLFTFAAAIGLTATTVRAESAPEPTKKAKKRKPKAKKRPTRTTLVKTVLQSLPKGWRLRTKGLPARMAGIATGPSGEIVVVSELERPFEPSGLDADARRWLLGRLGAQRGTIETGGVFGDLQVRGTVTGPDRRERALRAWVVPGKPAWLVSWVGPADRADRAEQSAAQAARRWAGS